MAVIVKDMNMPTNCSCCEFSKRLDNSRTYCTRKPFEKPVNDGKDRPGYCPLKEVKRMKWFKCSHEYGKASNEPEHTYFDYSGYKVGVFCLRCKKCGKTKRRKFLADRQLGELLR